MKEKYVHYHAEAGQAPTENQVNTMMQALQRTIEYDDYKCIGPMEIHWIYEIERDDMMLAIHQKVEPK